MALAFAAGVAGSIGPCVAPRYLALAGLAGGAAASARVRAAGSFIAGVLSGSVAIVAAGSLLIGAFNRSAQLYALLSVAFAAYGIWSLLHRDARPCHEPRERAASLGGTFLVGATSALLPSPCCSPVLLGLAALSAGSSDILHVVALAAAFSFGHVLPLAAASLTLAPLLATCTGNRARGAVRTVGAGLCVALGALYAILA